MNEACFIAAKKWCAFCDTLYEHNNSEDIAFKQRSSAVKPVKKGKVMGQQQLLLLVLAVIIVGTSIVVGIGIFNKNAEKSNIDMVVNEVVELSGVAHQYYLKPASMGGGEQKFTGLTLNFLTGGKASPIGTSLSLNVVDSATVEITGLCGLAKKSNGNPVEVVATVTPDDIQTEVKY
jgi:hypothetical protein